MAACTNITSVETEGARTTYRIELDVVVNNPVDTWRAAFSQTLVRTRLTAAEIIETIGSARDIHLLDCLYLLANPAQYDGCEVTKFQVRAGGEQAAADARTS